MAADTDDPSPSQPWSIPSHRARPPAASFASGASSLSDRSTDSREGTRDGEKEARCAVATPAVLAGEAAPPPPSSRRSSNVRRTASRTSSARPRPPVTVVPRHRRRGLFARLTVVPEVERPYEYPNATKWGITAIIGLATIAAPLGSSIIYPALPTITQHFDTTSTITNLTVALYMIAMSIFPLWWSSFSEQFGRRTIYLLSFALFLLFSLLSAVATSAPLLILFRVFTGGASASVQAVGAGTIADIWEVHERGQAMSMFYLGPLMGPLFAPILGGILAQELGWRSTMYGLTVYGFLVFLMLLFLLPETLEKGAIDGDSPGAGLPALCPTTTAQSAKIKTEKFAAALKRIFIDPLKLLLFLRFPPVLITVLVAAIAFGAVFVLNIAVMQGFSAEPYGFGQLVVGLLYIPSSLGFMCAALIGGKWIDNIMAREARRANRYDDGGKLIYLPEDRMRENMWLAHILYPLALLLFGWTLQYGLYWMIPSIGGFFFGIFTMLVFGVVLTMLTEFVHKQSSAGVALSNFVRNIFSCIGTIVAAPWIDAIGFGWVFTILAVVCMLGGGLGVWLLRLNAPRWRREMDDAFKNM